MAFKFPTFAYEDLVVAVDEVSAESGSGDGEPSAACLRGKNKATMDWKS